MRRVIAVALVVLVATCVQAGQSRGCTQKEAMQAENEAARLPDWGAVYASFTRFAHCNQGAIGEGYSDTIVRLLTRQWGEFADLHRPTAKNKRFERFVLGHIDALMTREDLRLIAENAGSRCPSQAKRLCRVIEDKLRLLQNRS
jgi:hypothetical protein